MLAGNAPEIGFDLSVCRHRFRCVGVVSGRSGRGTVGPAANSLRASWTDRPCLVGSRVRVAPVPKPQTRDRSRGAPARWRDWLELLPCAPCVRRPGAQFIPRRGGSLPDPGNSSQTDGFCLGDSLKWVHEHDAHRENDDERQAPDPDPVPRAGRRRRGGGDQVRSHRNGEGRAGC